MYIYKEKSTIMVSRILILSLVFGLACAATWRGKLPPVPQELAHKKGCYVEEINDVVPFGTEVKPIGHCYRINCDGATMHYASCGVVFISDPKCHVTEKDLTKPYPECCPQVRCDDDNKI